MTTDASILIKATDATKSAFASINGSMSKMNGELSKVKNAVFSAKGAILGLAGAGGFGVLIKMQADAAREATAYANALNMSVKDMTSWQYAAKSVNIESGKMADIFKDVSEKIGDAFATGGGEAAEVLERMNLKVHELVKLSPDKQMLAIAKGLGEIGTQSEKVQALEALASDASLLLPLLGNDSEKLKALIGEAELFNIALNDIDAAKIDAANRSFDKIGGIIKGVGNAIAVSLAPYLEYAANWFLETAKQAGGVGTVVNSAMDGSVTAIGYVITALDYMQIGWETLRLGVITFATVSLKALDSIIDPIRYVNELLGVEQPEAFKFLTHLVGDFEQAAINSQAKLVGLVANVGQNAESAKGKLQEIKQAADEVANIQVNAIAVGRTPEQAYEDMVVIKAAEQQAINEAMAYKWAAEETYRQQTLQAEELLNQQKLDAVQGTFGALSTLMSAQSKKLFKLGKASAIASALINTYEAITKTMASVPYPWNIPLAAAQGLAGMVQVQNIRAQQFTGARQFGGEVVGGTPYLVGERGPELFTPRTSGGITANKDMSAGNTNTIHMTVMANDVKSFEDALDRSENKIWNQIIKRMNEEGMRFA